MSRQDKATTERNARILRDLVKQPDNKACADCRKNDARWASWNLGVFLCIRCSGIHRSMGTHISKVKSIDLDIWTPEQMDSVQKWGNRRANLYWEKHLKAGHVPPEHKIESFIRSKYESRRWAMEGPVPSDPAVLESGAPAQAQAQSPKPTQTTAAAPPAPAPAPLPKTHPLLSRTTAAKAPAPTPAAAPIIDLFGSDEPPVLSPAITTAPQPTSPPTPAAAQTQATAGTAPPAPTSTATAPGTGIFDLDFRAPTPSSSNAKPQTAKADIMSLFSSTSPTTAAPSQSFFAAAQAAPAPPQNSYASWGGGITNSASPTQQHPTQTSLPTSGSGSGGWGGIQMDQNAWGAPTSASVAAQPPAPAVASQSNLWSSNARMAPAADPWSSTGNATGNNGFFGAQPAAAAKKDDRDPFANIWG